VYAADNIGHFGLASTAYTHFAIADQALSRPGRASSAARSGAPRPFHPGAFGELEAALPEVAAHCSARERTATSQARSGEPARPSTRAPGRETAAGFITGVTHFGLF
jgi:ribonuclease R